MELIAGIFTKGAAATLIAISTISATPIPSAPAAPVTVSGPTISVSAGIGQ